MANTYTQIYIQVVFVVKYRQCLIHPSWENELHKYMTGIIQNYGHKVLQINGIEDHVHHERNAHDAEADHRLAARSPAEERVREHDQEHHGAQAG